MSRITGVAARSKLSILDEFRIPFVIEDEHEFNSLVRLAACTLQMLVLNQHLT